jgi:hypothetical protein
VDEFEQLHAQTDFATRLYELGNVAIRTHPQEALRELNIHASPLDVRNYAAPPQILNDGDYGIVSRTYEKMLGLWAEICSRAADGFFPCDPFDESQSLVTAADDGDSFFDEAWRALDARLWEEASTRLHAHKGWPAQLQELGILQPADEALRPLVVPCFFPELALENKEKLRPRTCSASLTTHSRVEDPGKNAREGTYVMYVIFGSCLPLTKRLVKGISSTARLLGEPCLTYV